MMAKGAKRRSSSPSSNPSNSPWSVPVRRDDVPENGLHLDLAADAATRAAIAALAGVEAVPRLEATIDIARHGKGLRVEGEVSAAVEQICVVTVEPMTTEIREPMDLVFMPAAGAALRGAAEEEMEIDPTAADDPEELVDGVVDVGAAATEFLLLAIDPYPRKPGAVFEAPPSDDAGSRPFAALAALKKPPSDEK
ncbi:MAG TPA: DUF177 domain-containing protein [Xanthobacteraceae bacterium]|jgi:uncharacterized metal-binding protein YceD (DUF177 family)